MQQGYSVGRSGERPEGSMASAGINCHCVGLSGRRPIGSTGSAGFGVGRWSITSRVSFDDNISHFMVNGILILIVTC